jgi:shikimate dehydrogenase
MIAKQLKQAGRGDTTDTRREIVCLFGQPVSENPTEAMLQAVFRHHGLAWVYHSFEVPASELEAAVKAANTLGFRGFHCTLPHKETVIRHVDVIGQSAAEIGAVNCVIRTSKGLVGENTDGRGFLDALDDDRPTESSVLLFGAGGAARAIAVELVLAGVRMITIVNRTSARAELLAAHLDRVAGRHRTPLSVHVGSWGNAFAVDPRTDVIVNATSVGLYPDVEVAVPVAVESFLPSMIVADVIANPPRTPLLEAAETAGCVTVDGVEMLVNQGARSLRYWAGIDADKNVMRSAVMDHLGLEGTART